MLNLKVGDKVRIKSEISMLGGMVGTVVSVFSRNSVSYAAPFNRYIAVESKEFIAVMSVDTLMFAANELRVVPPSPMLPARRKIKI